MTAVHPPETAAPSTTAATAGTASLDYLRWRDELLQVMFWMAGEGIGSEPTAAQIEKFLGADPDVVTATLERMVEDGYVKQGSGGGFVLTDFGRHEGQRSFSDEFSDLQGQAHGECGPNCEFCHGPDGDPSACPSKTVAHSPG